MKRKMKQRSEKQEKEKEKEDKGWEGTDGEELIRFLGHTTVTNILPLTPITFIYTTLFNSSISSLSFLFAFLQGFSFRDRDRDSRGAAPNRRRSDGWTADRGERKKPIYLITVPSGLGSGIRFFSLLRTQILKSDDMRNVKNLMSELSVRNGLLVDLTVCFKVLYTCLLLLIICFIGGSNLVMNTNGTSHFIS